MPKNLSSANKHFNLSHWCLFFKTINVDAKYLGAIPALSIKLGCADEIRSISATSVKKLVWSPRLTKAFKIFSVKMS